MHIPEMSVTELYDREMQSVTLIDVREPDEYQAGHIEGSILIPLGDLATRHIEIPQDRPLVMVCRSGNRSSMAASWLIQQGHNDTYNLTGGMINWAKSGYPVEREA